MAAQVTLNPPMLRKPNFHKHTAFQQGKSLQSDTPDAGLFFSCPKSVHIKNSGLPPGREVGWSVLPSLPTSLPGHT